VGELVVRVAQRRQILVVLGFDSGVVAVMKFEIGSDGSASQIRKHPTPLWAYGGN